MAFGKNQVNSFVDNVVTGNQSADDAKKALLDAINAEKKAAADKAVKDYIKAQEKAVEDAKKKAESVPEEVAMEDEQTVSDISRMYTLLDGHVMYTGIDSADGKKSYAVVISESVNEEVLEDLLENFVTQTFGAEFNMTTSKITRNYTYTELCDGEIDMLDTAVCEGFLDLPLKAGVNRITSVDFPNSIIHIWVDDAMLQSTKNLVDEIEKEADEKAKKCCNEKECKCNKQEVDPILNAIICQLIRNYFC